MKRQVDNERERKSQTLCVRVCVCVCACVRERAVLREGFEEDIVTYLSRSWRSV